MSVIIVGSWLLKKGKNLIIIKKIINAFTVIGIPAQAVTVVIHETELENLGKCR
jgi:hypothetical protein